MKIFTSLMACIIALGSFAQNMITLDINHLVGNDQLTYESEFDLSSGDKAQLNRCEYYISEIAIHHDGGNITYIDYYWILVDAFDQMTYEIGEYDITEVESIDFSIGVENPYNHQDLTLWPADHPLAPQNPSMHWGWTPGYRFLAMEGETGASSADFTFQVHALGDVNYFDQNVPLSATAENGELHLVLDANYLEAFDNIATAEGGITHGESGDAITILENFRDEVFSAGTSVGIEEVFSSADHFQIVPNPTANGESSALQLSLSGNGPIAMQIVDITGKTVHKEQIEGHISSLDLPQLGSGTYLITLKSDQGDVLTDRWIVK